MLNPTKSMYLVVPPSNGKYESVRNMYLEGKVLDHVDSFRYLVSLVDIKITDDEDIKWELRSLSVRDNVLLMKFGFYCVDGKCYLLKNFRYSLYCAVLRPNFYKPTLYRLKVYYNNILRVLVGVAPWESARNMSVVLCIRSFDEYLRHCTMRFKKLVDDCNNELMCNLQSSDAVLMFKIII